MVAAVAINISFGSYGRACRMVAGRRDHNSQIETFISRSDQTMTST